MYSKASMANNQNENANALDERRKKRAEFDNLLSGNVADPLKVWNDYINWLEEAYPEGEAEESGLAQVLEECIGQLFSDPRYEQNEQFLQIFLKYAHTVEDLFETFNTIFSAGLFTDLALFYCNWSDRLRQEGDLSKAEEVLRTGQKNGAKPIGLLATSLDRLQKAIETQLADQQASDEDTENGGLSKRIHNSPYPSDTQICNVPKQTPDHTIPSSISGSSNAGTSQPDKQTETASPNAKVAIFNDENQQPAKLPTTSSSSSSSNTPLSPIQINYQKTCEQTHKPVRQPTTAIIAPLPVVELQKKIGDVPVVVNQQCLESVPTTNATQRTQKKQERSPKLFLSDKLSAKQQFHADLKRIYTNDTEFSFEEIRYRRWLAAKKKKQDEQKKLENEVQNLRKQVDQLMENKMGANPARLSAVVSTASNAMPAPGKMRVGGTISAFGSTESASHPSAIGSSSMRKNDENQFVGFSASATNDENQIERQMQDKLKLACVSGRENHRQRTAAAADIGDLDDDEEDAIAMLKTTKPPIPNLQDFSIYKDMTAIVDSDEPRFIGRPSTGMLPDMTLNNAYRNYNEANTIALPKSEQDFFAMCQSTPAAPRTERINRDDYHNCTINQVSAHPTGKLSPIVETSKEYKSSSSSGCSSGYNSTMRFRTFRK